MRPLVTRATRRGLTPVVLFSLALVAIGGDAFAAPRRASDKGARTAPAAAKPSASDAHDEPASVFVGAVARQGATPGIAERVENALARAFEKGGVRVVTGRSQGDGAPRGQAEDLARLLADARGRFFDGDFKGAVTQCDDAIARFESAFAYTDDDAAWRAYADLMVVRVLALQRLDKQDAADRALLALAAQRPGFVPDPGLAPPKVIERHRELLAKLKGEKAGTIVVESTPAGATVLVDGQKAGVTPLTIDSALPGPHYVAVVEGGTTKSEFVVLKSGTKTVRASFRSDEEERALALKAAVGSGKDVDELAPLATAVAPSTLVAVVATRGAEVSVLVGRFERGALAGVTVLETRDDLKKLDDDASLLADAALWTEGERTTDGKLDATARARFLGLAVRPAAQNAGASVDESEEEGGPGFLVFAGVGAGVAAVALVVAAAATTAVVAYLLRPPNPGGTDVVIDASRL